MLIEWGVQRIDDPIKLKEREMKQPAINIKNKTCHFRLRIAGHLYGRHRLDRHGDQVHPPRQGQPGGYLLLFCQRRTVGEEHARGRVFLWLI